MKRQLGLLLLAIAGLAFLAGCSDETVLAPEPVVSSTDDGSVKLDWEAVDGASGYRIYMAADPEVDPENYDSLDEGRKFSSESSPETISELDNFTGYYFVLTTIHGFGQETGASETVAAMPEPPFQPIGGINDTGVTQCLDPEQAEMVECPVEGYPGQDGEQQSRDRSDVEDSLEKWGDGPAGFDFTKIAETGAALPPEADHWACVRDNVTGLLWEAKRVGVFPEDDFRSADRIFYWYEPDPDRHGGFEGRPDQENLDCEYAADGICNTQDYVQALNGMQYCGVDDWGLPHHHEYMGIIDHSDNFFAAPGDWFYVGSEDAASIYDYWTTDTMVSRLPGSDGVPWVAAITSAVGGVTWPEDKFFNLHVRAVATAPEE